MELTNKPCIVSCGTGVNYGAGIDRLESSLKYHGYLGETMFWKTLPDGCPEHRGDGQYNFKVYALREAQKRGHKVLLWLDSSLYAIRDVMEIFDYIVDHGLFFFRTGYPLSATATDKLLAFAGEKREDLVEVNEQATGAVGINLNHLAGQAFLDEWERYMKAGMFGGNRVRDRADSTSPLFMFSRQDQSAASMIIHKMGIDEIGHERRWISYYPHQEETTMFFVKGL
jgi:hypothetical protein